MSDELRIMSEGVMSFYIVDIQAFIIHNSSLLTKKRL